MRHIIILSLFIISVSFAACSPKDLWNNDDDSKDVSSVESINNTSVMIVYNHDVEELSAENISNYSIEGLTVLSAVRDDADYSKVELVTSSQEAVEYPIIITNVERTDGELVDTTGDSDTFTGDALPSVVNVIATSNTGVDVIFSENINPAAAGDISNYSISGLSVLNANYDNDTTVHLVTDPQVFIEYTLTASNITDSSGNPILNNSDTFTGYYFCLSDVVSVDNTHVDVVFSSYVQLTGSEDISNYLIDSGGLAVLSASRDSANNSIVHLVTASQDNVTYDLVVNNVLSQNGEIIGSPDSDTFTGDALPRVVGITWSSSDSIIVNFSENIDISTANIQANYSIQGVDLSALNVLSATASGASVTLVTDYQNDIEYTVTVSNVRDMNGNLIDPANNSATFTGNACPWLVNVIWQPNNNLDVIFSEDVDAATAGIIGNYSIEEGLNITGAARDSVDHYIVHLVTDAQSDMTYTLRVSNVEDLAGNAIDPNPSTATFTGNASPYVVSVTNNGTVTIEVEYSENISSSALVIANYQFVDITTSTTIPIVLTQTGGFANIIRLTLSADLISGHQYELTVSSSVQDISGNSLLAPYIIPFNYP